MKSPPRVRKCDGADLQWTARPRASRWARPIKLDLTLAFNPDQPHDNDHKDFMILLINPLDALL